jgi:hypothetical protein
MTEQAPVYTDKELAQMEIRLRTMPDVPVDTSVVMRLLVTARQARRSVSWWLNGRGEVDHD